MDNVRTQYGSLEDFMEYVHSGEEDDERMFMPLFFYADEPAVCRGHSGEGYRRAIRQLRQLKLRCLFCHALIKTDDILKTLVLGDYKLSSTALPRRGSHHPDKPGRTDRLCRVSTRFNETTTAILFITQSGKRSLTCIAPGTNGCKPRPTRPISTATTTKAASTTTSLTPVLLSLPIVQR